MSRDTTCGLLLVFAFSSSCGGTEPGPARRGDAADAAPFVSGDSSAGSFAGATGALNDMRGPVLETMMASTGVGQDATGIAAGCVGTSSRAEAQLLPTDVVWAIDTSGSMIASFPAIQSALSAFSQRVSSAGIDAHIVLLAGAGSSAGPLGGGPGGPGAGGPGAGGPGAGGPGLGGLGGGALCVPAPLGSGQCGAASAPGAAAPDSREPFLLHLDLPFGFAEGMATLLEHHGSYAHLLRPNARTHLVLTEDGPPPQTPAQVADHLEGRAAVTASGPWNPPLQPGSWVFHGVVCRDGGGTGVCLLSLAPPQTTLDLIAQTGGLVSNLDEAGNGSGMDPFAQLLDKLAEQVIVGATISCDYTIPPPPSGETLDNNAVNVALVDGNGATSVFPRIPDGTDCADHAGWRFDDPAAPTQVILCPSACELAQSDANARIDVQFGCETLLL